MRNLTAHRVFGPGGEAAGDIKCFLRARVSLVYARLSRDKRNFTRLLAAERRFFIIYHFLTYAAARS